MFDPQTEALFSNAPELEGLDLDALARELTGVFADLVSTRVQMRGSRGATPEPELLERLRRCGRLARTYEGYVHLARDSDLKTSAAYVAGTAYKILAVAEGLFPGIAPSSRIGRESVPRFLAGGLLLAIAGYFSEGAELAAAVKLPAAAPPRRADVALVKAIALLLAGRLEMLRSLSWDNPLIYEGDEENAALMVAWDHLLMGVTVLGRELAGEPSDKSPERIFDIVYELTSTRAPSSLDSPGELGALPGPNHLAALLRQLPARMRECSLVNVPAPDGAAGGWSEFVGRMATQRPFLWPGHVSAIDAGILEKGTSAVVSYPTGAGKSLVATLKLAAMLARGDSAIYLSPTHALVGQIANELRETFPDATVEESLLTTGEYAELEGGELPDVAVMTPERCLTLLGIFPEAFRDVGTIIFDECHLMHPKEDLADRRAIDSMLCLLRLLAVAPKADTVLMSAMLANAQELAAWLGSIRPGQTKALELVWKPTRQLRGCLLFPDAEVSALNELLATEHPKAEAAKKERMEKAKAKGKPMKSADVSVPAAVSRKLLATPHGLFGLRSNWATKSSADYSFLRLSDEKLQLVASKFWRLTPNRNEVAARLAAWFGESGNKVLVFAQSKKACDKIADIVHEHLPVVEWELDPEDEGLLTLLDAELGGSEYRYADPAKRAASHHGLLLPLERRFNERKFRSSKNVPVLCATSTLAQGMNLPAEVVIIAGEDRFNPDSGRGERLAAHELLNAAGRAGRAGHNAYGVVLVVPGQVVQFDAENGKIGSRWIELQEELFSKSDQCLQLDDPLERVIDLVASAERIDGEEELLFYLADRLPVEGDGTLGDGAKGLFGRSLSSYRARDNADAYAAQVDALIGLATNRKPVRTGEEWANRVAAAAGVPLAVVEAVAARLQRVGVPDTVRRVVGWVLDWFGEDDVAYQTFMRTRSLSKTVGAAPKDAENAPAWRAAALPVLRKLADLWTTGGPLVELERVLKPDGKKLGKLPGARNFAINVVGDLAYAVGVVAQVARSRSDEEEDILIDLGLGTAAACVRDGVDDPGKLALLYQPNGAATRVQAHELAEELGEIFTGEEFDFSALQEVAASLLDEIWQATDSR